MSRTTWNRSEPLNQGAPLTRCKLVISVAKPAQQPLLLFGLRPQCACVVVSRNYLVGTEHLTTYIPVLEHRWPWPWPCRSECSMWIQRGPKRSRRMTRQVIVCSTPKHSGSRQRCLGPRPGGAALQPAFRARRFRIGVAWHGCGLLSGMLRTPAVLSARSPPACLAEAPQSSPPESIPVRVEHSVFHETQDLIRLGSQCRGC